MQDMKRSIFVRGPPMTMSPDSGPPSGPHVTNHAWRKLREPKPRPRASASSTITAQPPPGCLVGSGTSKPRERMHAACVRTSSSVILGPAVECGCSRAGARTAYTVALASTTFLAFLRPACRSSRPSADCRPSSTVTAGCRRRHRLRPSNRGGGPSRPGRRRSARREPRWQAWRLRGREAWRSRPPCARASRRGQFRTASPSFSPSLIACRPRDTNDLTVPTAQPNTRAVSFSDRSS